MDHLRPEDYCQAVSGEVPMEVSHRHTRRHLGCDAGGGSLDGVASLPAPADDARPGALVDAILRLPVDERCISLAHCQAAEDLLSLNLEAARLAREDLALLLKLPQEKWRPRVERATSRFRDRAFAEALLDEAHRRVRSAPLEAAELARLVRTALDREDGDLLRPWARALVARAQAQVANALRIAGDLAQAAEVFGRLLRSLTARPVDDLFAVAEIKGLEASLAIDRRRFAEAEECLRVSAQLHGQCDSHVGQAKALVNLANLHRSQGELQRMAQPLDQAEGLIDRTDHPHLYFCIVQARINALLDLGCGQEARRVLADGRDVFLVPGDGYKAAFLTGHEARVALLTGRPADAVAGFESARDQFLSLDRSYDAIMASLYLADALLAADRSAEVRELALSLVPMFQARGVARETLAALRLLTEAARTEAVTTRVLAQVRDRLSAAVTAENPP